MSRVWIVVAGAAIATATLTASGCGSSQANLSDRAQLFVVALGAGGVHQLTSDRFDHSAPTWSPNGHRLADAIETPSGAGIEVIEREGRLVRRIAAGHEPAAQPPAWSPDGRQLAFDQVRDTPDGIVGRLVVADVRTGRIAPVTDMAIGRPAWSPHGRTLAFIRGAIVPVATPESGPPADELWIASPRGGDTKRLLGEVEDQFDPQWSADGHRILFGRPDAAERSAVWLAEADGTMARRVVGGLIMADASWAPRRDSISVGITGAGSFRVYLFSGTGRARPLTPKINRGPVAWSPDGKLVAFARDERLIVIGPGGAGERTVVRLAGAEISDLAWSPDGKRLAFVARKQQLED